MKHLTIEECREIEIKVLEKWFRRAEAQRYKVGHKKTTELQAEFMLGMVAALDILTDADTTGESSISPKIFFSIMQGKPITL